MYLKLDEKRLLPLHSWYDEIVATTSARQRKKERRISSCAHLPFCPFCRKQAIKVSKQFSFLSILFHLSNFSSSTLARFLSFHFNFVPFTLSSCYYDGWKKYETRKERRKFRSFPLHEWKKCGTTDSDWILLETFFEIKAKEKEKKKLVKLAFRQGS